MSVAWSPEAQQRVLLTKAVFDRFVVAFTYKGLRRIVEPHALGSTGEHAVLVGYQTAGKSSGELPGWRVFELSGIEVARVLALQFVPRAKSDRAWRVLKDVSASVEFVPAESLGERVVPGETASNEQGTTPVAKPAAAGTARLFSSGKPMPVGKWDADTGVYRTWRRSPLHVVKKYQGFGISEDILDQLREVGCVTVELDVRTDSGRVWRYKTPLSAWLALGPHRRGKLSERDDRQVFMGLDMLESFGAEKVP